MKASVPPIRTSRRESARPSPARLHMVGMLALVRAVSVGNGLTPRLAKGNPPTVIAIPAHERDA